MVGVYSSETGIREVKQLINLTYSLQGLSLLTDLTDGNRVGLRLYLDRHLAISEEEKSRICNAYAQKIFSEGKCKFLPHGILVDRDSRWRRSITEKPFQNTSTDRMKPWRFYLLKMRQGIKMLLLPTDITVPWMTRKELNIAAFAEGHCERDRK